MFSLLMVLPSLILFSAAYLLWEGHSLGWKLSIATCGISSIDSFTNSDVIVLRASNRTFKRFSSNASNSKWEKNGSQTKDSPIVTENVVKFGLRLSIIACISIVMTMVAFIVAIASPFLSINFFISMKLNLPNVQRICQGLPRDWFYRRRVGLRVRISDC